MKILITGSAGFIGSHLAEKILKTDYKGNIQVIGVDNLNDYYSPKRKEANVSILNRYSRISTAREGLAVVKLDGSACSGCGFVVPPQDVADIRDKDNYYTCDICSRFIYFIK